MFRVSLPLLALALLATASQASGRQPAGAAQVAPPAEPPQEIQLSHHREVFFYPSPQRRDPFRPLVGADEAGPDFEDLQLMGILFSASARESVALIVDDAGNVFRVRQGESIGRSRVVEIGPRRVVFAVERFGIVRQEILELITTEPEGVRP